MREILGEIAYRTQEEFRQMQWCIFKHLHFRTSFLQSDLQDLASWSEVDVDFTTLRLAFQTSVVLQTKRGVSKEKPEFIDWILAGAVAYL